MFKCDSFLLKPNIIVTPDNLNENIFISIKDVKEVSAIKNDIDLNYVEGAISLKYFDSEIFGMENWDLIDQLWSYLVNMIISVREKGSAKTFFPDQPTRLEMSRIANNQILFSVEANDIHKWNFPEKDFFSILLESAHEFFNFMIEVFPERDVYGYELSIVEDLKREVGR